jgi:protein-disulfide isomerase
MDRECPLCKKEVDEKLIQTCADAEKWVVGQIKKNHKDWVAADGSCPQCLDYYRKLGESK